MNKEILYEILNSKSERLTLKEIKAIMDEELDKSPEEMDTDLVELCLDALESVDDSKLNKRTHKIKLARVLIVAAILVLTVTISIPVCAKYLHITVPESIVNFYDDCFHVNLSKDVYVVDIVDTLEKEGVTKVVLPKVFLEDKTKIINYRKLSFENGSNYIFDFSIESVKGRTTVSVLNESFDILDEYQKVKNEFESIKYLNKNKVSIIVFSKDNQSFIVYSLDQIKYDIVLDCDYDTAYKIAETI